MRLGHDARRWPRFAQEPIAKAPCPVVESVFATTVLVADLFPDGFAIFVGPLGELDALLVHAFVSEGNPFGLLRDLS